MRTGPALYLAMCFGASSAFGQAVDYSELERIVELSGTAYVTARDEFLRNHSGLLDVEAGVKVSWQVGLLSMIVSARASDIKQFSEWDEYQPLARTRSGKPTRHPATDAAARDNAKAQVFLVERLWKLAPDMHFEREAFEELLRRLPGPTTLWIQVAQSAPSEKLKAIALHALVVGNSDAVRDILSNTLNDRASHEELKIAILRGVCMSRPQYGTSIILNSFDKWRDNLRVTSIALSALAKLPDEDARAALHNFARDTVQPTRFRLAAIVACGDVPKDSDLACFGAILGEECDDELRRRVSSCLSRYPFEKARPLVQRCLADTSNERVVSNAISILGVRGAEADLEVLTQLQQNASVSEDLRNKAKQSVQAIMSRVKPRSDE